MIPQTPPWEGGNSTSSSTEPCGTLKGIRTPVSGVKGRQLGQLVHESIPLDSLYSDIQHFQFLEWSRIWDLNSYVFRRNILSVLCLPFPPIRDIKHNLHWASLTHSPYLSTTLSYVWFCWDWSTPNCADFKPLNYPLCIASCYRQPTLCWISYKHYPTFCLCEPRSLFIAVGQQLSTWPFGQDL